MADDRTAADLARLLHRLRRREARRRGGADLTYRELAAKTGWSLGIIAQYFSGKTLPPIDRFDVLVRLLGASVAEQGAMATARDRADEQRRGERRPAPARSTFEVLGPVEAAGPAGVAKLVGVRQRALVGLLALNAGRVVSQARLVDALWGEDPPRTAVQTLYSHVARVRQALDACGLRGVLRTQDTGYLLAIGPDEVDVGRFEKRVDQARLARANGDVAGAAAHLREGLAHWRGDALANAPAHGWGAAEAERLDEMRRSAQEDLWEARLHLGEHAATVGEIEKSLISQPGRERSVELLMLALYRSGRPADALESYRRLRGHLADDLGIEPGARVRSLHTTILRRDADLDLAEPTAAVAGPARPAQLPPQAGHFTGRAAELSTLNDLLGPRSRVGVVSGPAGMGKTALAVRWARAAAGRYGDGQLFLDLRGHDPATAVPVADALTYLLAGLGLPAAQIPADPAALLGLYRSALYQRRVLILLDNAASADQVAALVPPSPSQLLVTSRNRMAGLAVDHAVVSVDLDVLLADDALLLLRRVLGADRVAGEDAAARRLVELCGRMPLALRIAAAKLTVRPRGQVAGLVAELSSGDRLDALVVPGDSRSLRTVFAGAYRALSPLAAQLFRRLGQHPGPTFAAGLAVAVVDAPVTSLFATAGLAGARSSGSPVHLARAALDELTAAHLVANVGADRYRFHDLIGVYAFECAEPADRVQSVSRTLDWYLSVADAASRVLEPARDRAGPVLVNPPVDIPFPAEHDQVLAFLDAERANLLPVVRHAVSHGDDRTAWRLTYLLTGFHSMRGHWSTLVEMGRLGLAAAQRLADPAAEALMRSWLGLACNATQAYEEALEHLGVALTLMRAAGDLRGLGTALNNIALAYDHLGRLDVAMETFGQALALHTANSHQPGMATALNNIGHTYVRMGRPDLAREYLHRALVMTRRLGLPGYEAYNLHSLGEALLAAADHDAALEHFVAALAIRRRLGERRLEADTLNSIGLTHADRGDHAAAAVHFSKALALGRRLGDRCLETTTLAYLDTVRSPQA